MNPEELSSNINSTLYGSQAVQGQQVETISVPTKDTQNVPETVLPVATNTIQSQGAPVEVVDTNVVAPEQVSPVTSEYMGGTTLPNVEYNTETRPLDDSDGDAFYFKNRYNEVEAFEVPIPSMKSLATSNTKDMKKLGWQIATKVEGLPDVGYFGYNRVPNMPSEDFAHSATRGLLNTPMNLLTGTAKGLAIASADILMHPDNGMNMQKNFAKSPAGQIINKAFGKGIEQFKLPQDIDYTPFIKSVDNFANKVKEHTYLKYTDIKETGISGWAKAGMYAGSGIGSVGTAILAGAPVLAASEMLSAYADTRIALADAGVPAGRAVSISALTGGVVGGLSRVGSIGVGAESIAAVVKNEGKNLLNYSAKEIGKKSAKIAGKGMVGDIITEPLQDDVQAVGAANLDLSALNNRWDDRVYSMFGAMMGGVLSVGTAYKAGKQTQQGLIDEGKEYTNSVNTVIEKYKPMWDDAVKNGILTKEDVNGLMEIARDPNSSEIIMNNVKESIAGQFDKVPLETQQEFEKKIAAIDPNVILADEYSRLDARVIDKLNESASKKFETSDRALISSVMRGYANLELYLNGKLPSEIDIPNFSDIKSKNKFGAASIQEIGINTEKAANNLYNMQKSSPYNPMVQEEAKVNVDPISQRHGTILHEMAHWIDEKIGVKGTGDFLANYYEAVSKVFGKDKAASVKAKAGENRNLDTRMTGKDYTNEFNTSEYFAQAIGRLGADAAEPLGIKGKVSDFVGLANLMMQGMNKATIVSQGVQNYLSELDKITKSNGAIVLKIAEAYGSERMNNALQEYMATNFDSIEEANIPTDVLKELTDVLNSFVDRHGGIKLSQLFEGIETDSFVEKTQKLFDKSLQVGRDLVANNPNAKNIMPATTATEPSVTGVEPIEGLPTAKFDISTIENDNIFKGFSAPVTQTIEDSISTPRQSDAQRLLTTKVDGLSLSDDMNEVKSKIQPNESKAGKVFAKMAGSWSWGTLSEKMRALGGQKLVDHFDLLGKNVKYEDKLFSFQSTFENKILNRLFAGNKESMQKGKFIALNARLSGNYDKVSIYDKWGKEVGNKIDKVLTGFEAMDFYINSKQGDNVINRMKTQYGEEEYNRILSKVEADKEITGYADSMMEMLQEMKPELEAARGKKFEAGEEFYFPILDADEASKGKSNINSMCSRKFTTSPISAGNALELFDRYVRRASSMLSERSSTIKRIKDLFFFDDKSIQGTIMPNESEDITMLGNDSSSLRMSAQQILGEKGFQNLQAELDDYLNYDDKSPVAVNGTINKIGQSITRGLLSWKPLSFIKNATNITSFWGVAPDSSKYYSDTLYYVSHPKEAWDMMKNIPAVKRRVNGQDIEDMLNKTTADGDTVLNGLRNYKIGGDDKYNVLGKLSAVSTLANRMGLKLFMQSGDAFANVFGGAAYYKQLLDLHGVEKANNEFGKFIESRQSSSNQSTKSLLQRQWNRQGLMGNFIAFTSEGVVKGRVYANAVDSLSRGEISTKEFAKQIAPVFMSQMLFGLVSAGIYDLFSDDEEKSEKAQKGLMNEAIQAVGGVSPFGNIFIAPAVEYFAGTGQGQISPPVLTEVMRYMQDMKQGDVDELIGRSIAFTGLLSGAPNVINVLEGAERLTSGNEEEQAIGAYQIGGRSESFGRKRTGIEKKTVDKKDEE